jgi:MOSC domain-containing protein YiiM
MTADALTPVSEESRSGEAGSIVSVQVGQVAPLGPDGVPSAFAKSPAKGPVAVGRLGLVGDAQADLTVHGGPDKAVYLYPAEHYVAWSRELPEHTELLVPGGFGENLTTLGLDEGTVCIGDVFRAGSALLQITQPRQPCFKLGLRFGDTHLPRAFLRSGRSGWYARVLEEGVVASLDPVVVLERPNPRWPVSRLVRLITHRLATPDDMSELAELPGVASDWRRIAIAAGQQAAGRDHDHPSASGPASGSSLS